jgi:hypothetical protein
VLTAAIAVTGGWAFVLLRRTPGWNPWLPWMVAGATAVAVLALALGWWRGRHTAARPDGVSANGISANGPDGEPAPRSARRSGRLFAVIATAGLIAVLAGPAAYALTPLSQTAAGSNPLAGPTAGGGGGGFGGFAGGLGRLAGGLSEPVSEPAAGGGRTGTGTGTRAGTGGLAGAGRAGGLGGTASAQLIAYLKAHRDGATWLVAVQGSSAAAAIILQTGGLPVMAMGGFRGTDPAPTVAQLEQYVAQGKLHYVMTGGRGGFGGAGAGAGSAGTVTSWVEQNCTAVPASAYGAATSGGTSGGAATSAGLGTGAAGLYRCG